jgi:hypothetical protein
MGRRRFLGFPWLSATLFDPARIASRRMSFTRCLASSCATDGSYSIAFPPKTFPVNHWHYLGQHPE